MQRAFSRPRYVFYAIIAAACVFLGIIWTPNVPLLLLILTDSSIPLRGALSLSLQLLVSSVSDVPILTLVYFAATSLLIGINVSLFLFYVRLYRTMPSASQTTSGIVGVVAAFLGLGCAACGSLVLFSIVGTSGAGLIALLPYHGEEIKYVGLFLLMLSTILLARAINKPPVCPPVTTYNLDYTN